MTVTGALSAWAERLPRRHPEEDQVSIIQREEEREAEGWRAPEGRPEEEGAAAGCAAKKVAFAVLPDNYEPLGWEAEQRPPPTKAERASKSRKRKLKKYGKNVGKVLRKGCHYLVLGLQGLANAYTSPLGLAIFSATAGR